MKRLALHILFWVAYLSQDTLLAFLWGDSKEDNSSILHQVVLSFAYCAALLPPKILFTYFLLYIMLDRILKQNKVSFINIFYLILAAVFVLLTVRAIELYFVYPVVLHRAGEAPPYFNPFSFLFAFIDLGYISGAAIAIRQVRLQLAGKEREKNLIKEKLETELKFLRNQTNPHFLLNTLNNIYALARKKSDDTAEVVMRLSELLRFMLYESNGNLIKLSDEIKILEDYLELETLRYNKRLTISFHKEVDEDVYKITPLLLLPFLENAFKHGISETRFESFINVYIKANEGCLNFEIENTKDNSVHENSSVNIGLVNVKRRLELTYSDYKIDVHNNNDTFKVNLSVNLNSYVEI